MFSNHVAYIKRARVVNNVILPRLSKLAGRGGRRMMTAKDICQPCVRSLAKVEVRNPLPLAQRKQPTFTQLIQKVATFFNLTHTYIVLYLNFERLLNHDHHSVAARPYLSAGYVCQALSTPLSPRTPPANRIPFKTRKRTATH